MTTESGARGNALPGGIVVAASGPILVLTHHGRDSMTRNVDALSFGRCPAVCLVTRLNRNCFPVSYRKEGRCLSQDLAGQTTEGS